MGIQESRARSRTPRSSFIWVIPVEEPWPRDEDGLEMTALQQSCGKVSQSAISSVVVVRSAPTSRRGPTNYRAGRHGGDKRKEGDDVSHIVRETDWGTIDIVVDEARVFFQQRWKYTWVVRTPLLPWSLQEKRDFHKHVDRQIWASWSNKVKLGVSGTSAFARRFARSQLPINLDVRWVLKDEQWDVTAWKVPDSEMPHNTVTWSTRKIVLHTSKLKAYTACNDATPKVCSVGFRSVPHEFGHAIGNVSDLGRGDEYVSTSPNLADADSILNIGKQLRQRHFTSILEELNKMIQNTTFTVRQTG